MVCFTSSGHHYAYIGPSGSSNSCYHLLAYMIAALRMRNCQVVLMSPSGTHPTLTNQASVNLDWIAADAADMDDPCGRSSSHQLPPSLFPSMPLPTIIQKSIFRRKPKRSNYDLQHMNLSGSTSLDIWEVLFHHLAFQMGCLG